MSYISKAVPFLLVVTSVCVGCSNRDTTILEESPNAMSSIQNNDFDGMNWVQASQESIEYYDSLNLDGTGICDDKLYISLYRWCDSDTAVIVFRIKLGTGEMLAEVIPCDGYYDLYFGHIFSDKKDAVIIQIGVPRSNYGASRLYVYDVYGNDSLDPYPCIIEKFDCAGENDFAPKIDANIPRDDVVIEGTEIVDLEGGSLQGIKLQFNNNGDKWNNIENIIYWNKGGWSTVS